MAALRPKRSTMSWIADVMPSRGVAIAAYYRAEQRGFAPGYDLEDWLEAEARIGSIIGKD